MWTAVKVQIIGYCSNLESIFTVGSFPPQHTVGAYLSNQLCLFLIQFSVLPRPFSEGGTPCRFLVTPCPFQEAEMTPCPFLGDAQRRPVTFYLTPNVTVHGNRRGNYAARTFPLFYSTAFVIVIRLVYKNLRYWPIRIYFGRLAMFIFWFSPVLQRLD